MAIKERRTKILLSLFLLTDVNLTPISFTENIQQIFDLSMNQKTRGTLSGMMKEGLIQKTENGKQTTEDRGQKSVIGLPSSDIRTPSSDLSGYKLTEKGFAELCLDFPFFRYLRSKWDGHWRILSYEIPEKKRELRDKLRRKVSAWGLGPWHRSFWVSPHPIISDLKNLISQKEEEKYVQAFESTHVFGDREILIKKVWDTEGLDKKYRGLFKNWHDILSKEEDKVTKLQKVVNLYVELLRIDPGLPKELVGESWIGYEAFSIFKEIRSILLS